MAHLGERLRWRRLPWVIELVSILAGYGLYSLVRLLAPHHLVDSYGNANKVLNLERATGLFHELSLNALLTQHLFLADFSSYWYATAHFVVTPVLLVWLFREHGRAYPLLRSGLVIATVGALVIYAAWPLAPPRFAIAGAVDTVTEHPVIWAKGGAAAFVNEFAAMPSLHVAWAVWCAVAVVVVLRSPWRHLAWLYPVTTTTVVVATANHYLLDAIGGLVVVLAALSLCGLRPRHFLQATLAQEIGERPGVRSRRSARSQGLTSS